MKIGKIEDNLDFITWIVEEKTKSKLGAITPTKDSITFIFTDGREAVESCERVEKTLDPWLDLVREVYNNPDIKYVKLDRRDKIVKVGDKIMDIKSFEENLKDKLIAKIEYECILNRIPYTGIEKLYQCKPTEIMDVYTELELRIKNYCLSRKPIMPLSLEVYSKGSRNILKL